VALAVPIPKEKRTGGAGLRDQKREGLLLSGLLALTKPEKIHN